MHIQVGETIPDRYNLLLFHKSHVDSQEALAMRVLRLLLNLWRDILIVNRAGVESDSASESRVRCKARLARVV